MRLTFNLFPQSFPKIPRTNMVVAFENMVEIALVRKATMVGYFYQGLIRTQEQA